MKGVCHASFSTIRKFLRDVIEMPVSRGYLSKVIAKVSDALEPTFDELLNALPEQTVLHIDETGHKDNGERFWTWCFKAAMSTLFRLDNSRGSQVLLDVLGDEFRGGIGEFSLTMRDNVIRYNFIETIRGEKPQNVRESYT